MQQTPQPDLSVFLASSAHDMKNSLGMLSGLLEKFLAEQTESGFSGYKDLASMLYETRRINNDLMQLLALYKLDQHLYPFDPHPVEVSEFLAELAAQNARLLASRHIDLACDCPDGLIGHFDEDLLQGAINQALNNASQYTRGHIRLAAASVDGMVEIRVEDDGAGYPDSMLGDESTQLGVDFNRGSTGLGLHFARSVAALHKNKGRSGSLRLENGGRLGGGCFILQLP